MAAKAAKENGVSGGGVIEMASGGGHIGSSSMASARRERAAAWRRRQRLNGGGVSVANQRAAKMARNEGRRSGENSWRQVKPA